MKRQTQSSASAPAQTKPTRRVGAETSKTRHTILDAVERVMLDQGYAGVTYGTLAAAAGVSPQLVQYYFPTVDDVFLAAIRRNVDSHVERLVTALKERSHEPLRVLWEFSTEEAAAALMIEFTALGNHRKSIKSAIGQATERIHQIQLDAISTTPGSLGQFDGELSPTALLFLLTGIPKLLCLEASVGVSTAHAEVMRMFDRYLANVEPPPPTRRRRNSKAPSNDTKLGNTSRRA